MKFETFLCGDGSTRSPSAESVATLSRIIRFVLGLHAIEYRVNKLNHGLRKSSLLSSAAACGFIDVISPTTTVTERLDYEPRASCVGAWCDPSMRSAEYWMPSR